MSSSNGPSTDYSSHQYSGFCGGHWGKKGNWSAMNIAAMVLGFVLFWPLGLFMVYWIVSGRDAYELPQAAREQWQRLKGKSVKGGCRQESDNTIFNEFQKTQYDRIKEIKDEIRERSQRFNEFRSDAKRRADEDEFNRFMASTPLRNDS